MAMSTGAKVAIGCGAAILIVGGIGAAVVVGGAYWVKGKADTFVARAQKMQKLKEEADANAFTPPADGVIPEDRLVAYIAIRKGQVEYLLAHEQEIAKLHEDTKDPKKTPSLGDVTSSISILGGIEETLYQSLAAQKMGGAEYHWLLEEVYRSEFASHMQKETGKTVSGATNDAADTVLKSLKAERDSAQVKKALPDSEESLSQMNDIFEEMEAKAKSGANAVDVPQANIDLIRKHDDEIRKYCMTGLEAYGL